MKIILYLFDLKNNQDRLHSLQYIFYHFQKYLARKSKGTDGGGSRASALLFYFMYKPEVPTNIMYVDIHVCRVYTVYAEIIKTSIKITIGRILSTYYNNKWHSKFFLFVRLIQILTRLNFSLYFSRSVCWQKIKKYMFVQYTTHTHAHRHTNTINDYTYIMLFIQFI